jgi:hypothetical protein
MLFPPESVATMQGLIDDALETPVEFSIGGAAPSSETGDTYDPLTDLDTPGDATAPENNSERITIHGAQLPSEPDRYAAQGMNVVNSITLRVSYEKGFKPAPGMSMIWPAGSGDRYTVKAAKAIAPNGVPTSFIVDGEG